MLSGFIFLSSFEMICGKFLSVFFVNCLLSSNLSFFCLNHFSCDRPNVIFEKRIIDFGVIKPNSFVSDTIKLTNIGCQSLVIHDVKSSCGCSVAKYTKSPIPSNQSGRIVVTFHASFSGKFEKSIVVVTNTEEKSHLIKIKGFVSEL